jgi:hypothetical protein
MANSLRSGLWLGLGILAGLPWVAGQDLPVSGPAAEKRFPPLKLPPGFKATLYAADPMVEYPSAVALGPRRGSVFVAADYMTGLGVDIVRRDEIRLLEDTDGDGYADKSSVFAKGFNSIQGLTYEGGTLYVMHAPYLTSLRDTKGMGQADQRIDLLSGLGLTPEQNPPRLARWLREERRPEAVAFVLDTLRSRPSAKVAELLLGVVRATDHASANRLLALELLEQNLGKNAAGSLFQLAQGLEDGPVFADVFQRLDRLSHPSFAELLPGKLFSQAPEIRAASLGILANRNKVAAEKALRRLLEDGDARVRSAAATAAGKLKFQPAADVLLKTGGDADSQVRKASLDALRQMG